MGFVKKLIFSVVTLFRKNKLDRIQKEIEKTKISKEDSEEAVEFLRKFSKRESLYTYIYNKEKLNANYK